MRNTLQNEYNQLKSCQSPGASFESSDNVYLKIINELLDCAGREVDAIVGKDLAWSFLGGEGFARGPRDQPMGVLTSWGWFVIGATIPISP